MDKETLSYFKGLLESQLMELASSANATVHQLIDTNEDPAIEFLDLAASETARGYALRIRDRESRLMKKIINALECIEDGSYGLCEACEGDIGIRRLQARPVTRYCISCNDAGPRFFRNFDYSFCQVHQFQTK